MRKSMITVKRPRKIRRIFTMSKKNRAQHSTPRRHGDRNVQTRYSGKHQCGDDPIRESSLHNCPGRACGGACHEADEAVCMDGIGLTLIPVVLVMLIALLINMVSHFTFIYT